MYYLINRYYNANVGRFISEDPVMTTNLYAYSGNDPVNLTDSSGLLADDNVERRLKGMKPDPRLPYNRYQGTGGSAQGNSVSNTNHKDKTQQNVDIIEIVTNVVENRKTIAKYVFDGKSYTVSGNELFDVGLVFDDKGIRPLYGGGASIPGFSVMKSEENAKTGWYLNGFAGIFATGQYSLDENNQLNKATGLSVGKALGITVDYVGDPIFKW